LDNLTRRQLKNIGPLISQIGADKKGNFFLSALISENQRLIFWPGCRLR